MKINKIIFRRGWFHNIDPKNYTEETKRHREIIRKIKHGNKEQN